MDDRVDVICANDGDRSLARAALRGAVLRYGMECRQDAYETEDPVAYVDLLEESMRAFEIVAKLEAA